jgi:hypothetical protein
MRITNVQALGGHRLRLRFDDGAVGEVDLAGTTEFVGLMRPLKNPAEFAKVQLNAEFGTIGWDNGVELDSHVLYSQITGAPLPGGELLPSSLRPPRRAKRKKSAAAATRVRKTSSSRAHAG